MGDLVIPVIHIIDQQTSDRGTLWQPGRDQRKGDYYQVDDNLYQVGNGGRLKFIKTRRKTLGFSRGESSPVTDCHMKCDSKG